MSLTCCPAPDPEGFEADNDGGLGIIRGSHLFRDTLGCRAAADPTTGRSADEVMAAGWLKDKTHPVTGQPLAIERFALPQGSIAVVLSHGAHGVAPKALTKNPRLCTLMAYRKAVGDIFPSPGRQVRSHYYIAILSLSLSLSLSLCVTDFESEHHHRFPRSGRRKRGVGSYRSG